MEPNFCKTYFDIQGVEILGMKIEQETNNEKPIAQSLWWKEY